MTTEKRVICVSWNEALAKSRELLLRSLGLTVLSALYEQEARSMCREDADLLILGHSVPKAEKRLIIQSFREHSMHPFCRCCKLVIRSCLKLHLELNRPSRKKCSALFGKSYSTNNGDIAVDCLSGRRTSFFYSPTKRLEELVETLLGLNISSTRCSNL